MEGRIGISCRKNPNCLEVGQVVFNEIEPALPIKGIVASTPEGDAICDVVAVSSESVFSQAYAQKINDSGEGVAYLIFGQDWGIRIRPQKFHDEPWDLENTHQWGEAYKVYGSEQDILFEKNTEL